MNIYLASRWARKLDLHPMRQRIQELGHIVTSGWLDEENDPPEVAANHDIADIDRADLLILWHELRLPVQSLYGGLFVEVGYALGTGKPVWVVEDTKPTCIFFTLPNVTRFACWEDCFQVLESHTIA